MPKNTNLMDLVEDETTSEFYPTPKALAEKMVALVNWKIVSTVLEPSAGKGDILKAVAREVRNNYFRDEIDVDCIEADANLRQILSYNFSDERKRSINDTINELKKNAEKKALSDKERDKLASLNEELSSFFSNGIRIVGDDFLAYNPFKRYDLLIMNPPFSEGDKHLLKALEMQKNGGQVICLLNAETIYNPYTKTRRELVKLLEKYNYKCEFVQNAFCSAERSTAVEVALISVNIPYVQEESDIYERMKKAEHCEEYENCDYSALEVTDFIQMIIAKYRAECRTGLEVIRQYKAALPYLQNEFGEHSFPIIKLTLNGKSGEMSENKFLKSVRYKYWKALLANPKFVGKLTSKLQSEYSQKVYELSEYEFDKYNITTLATQMNAQIKSGIEDEIEAMFDRMTEKHSYYPEFLNNRHYFNGWRTNKVYKVEKKVILPCYGIFSRYDGTPSTYAAYEILADIERIFNFLDGNMTREVDLRSQIDFYFHKGITRNIHCKYFDVTFYKKGTVHITFTNAKLVERFNIYVTKRKGWLPPSYGKKSYKSMDADEKVVVDEFQGEKVYDEVMINHSYYFAPVTSNNNFLALDTAEAS